GRTRRTVEGSAKAQRRCNEGTEKRRALLPSLESLRVCSAEHVRAGSVLPLRLRGLDNHTLKVRGQLEKLWLERSRPCEPACGGASRLHSSSGPGGRIAGPGWDVPKALLRRRRILGRLILKPLPSRGITWTVSPTIAS